ncbi:hypothetical protein LG3211_1654 [Lysobacter gummosus]|nr:hypothetical protein LG3211_1654 [Lysobacter gummosus]
MDGLARIAPTSRAGELKRRARWPICQPFSLPQHFFSRAA